MLLLIEIWQKKKDSVKQNNLFLDQNETQNFSQNTAEQDKLELLSTDASYYQTIFLSKSNG